MNNDHHNNDNNNNSEYGSGDTVVYNQSFRSKGNFIPYANCFGKIANWITILTKWLLVYFMKNEFSCCLKACLEIVEKKTLKAI